MNAKHLMVLAVLALAAGGPAAEAAAQARPVRVFISADMEGVVGTVTGDQLGPAGFEYQRSREHMTREVLAAIEGARAAGATEFVVADAHGNGQNLLIDQFPNDVTIVRSWPRPLGMMQGIDSSFAAAIFIGYHAGTTNPAGVRAHTFSSATLADVRLNGRSVPEGGVNAAVAGWFGVPVVMVSGDDAAVAEVRGVIGAVEGAVVKWHYGFHSARTLTPDSSYRLIRAVAETAVRNAARARPYRVAGQVTLDLRFKNYRPAEVLSYLPVVERTDAHSVRFVGRDILEVVRFLGFVTNYAPNLEP
jgi:D-amino peptidase